MVQRRSAFLEVEKGDLLLFFDVFGTIENVLPLKESTYNTN